MASRRVGVVAISVAALLGLTGTALAAGAGAATGGVTRYAADQPVTGVDSRCFAAADSHVDPKVRGGVPTNPAYYVRDALNQYCATLRLRDQATSPAFGTQSALSGAGLWLAQLGQQVSDAPAHLHGGVTTLVPGSQAADPFRTVERWEARTGGDVLPVRFTSSDGAQLRGNLWLPPPGVPPTADRGYPGVVITDGSVQAYEQLYYWAAEGLAQYGYEVLTYDVQGQGDSDLLPAGCPLPTPGQQCTRGVPYQQSYNFYQGAEDSLSYFLSTPDHPYRGTYNPGWKALDPNAVGIAGHSLGAEAVSWVGQCDARVHAIVAWDDLLPVQVRSCARNVFVPSAVRASAVHAPALAMTNDYEFNPQPNPAVPDPNGSPNGGGLDGTAGYLSLAKQGVDSEVVSIRNGTHLTYSYIPYVLPANEIGERVAFYYTLAWFDAYLRAGHDPLLPVADTAFRRLTSLGRFDASADRNDNRTNPTAADISMGAGIFSPARAVADPASPAAGNVPYEIRGIPIRNTLSFYYYSEYHLHAPGGRLAVCTDMLAGCPGRQPRTP